MIVYFDSSKLLDINSSFFFYNTKSVRVVKKDYDVKNVSLIKDTILLFDPLIRDLELALDLKKEVVLLLSCVSDEYTKYLLEVKHVLIFEKVEELALQNHNIKNYTLIKPTISKSETNQLQQNNRVLVLDPISEFKREDAEFLSNISFDIPITYSGYKTMNNNSQFRIMMKVLHSRTFIKHFPILDYEDFLANHQYVMSFVENKFPIVIYKAIQYGSIPFLLSNRYRSWILPELQSKDYEVIIDIYNNSNTIQQRQKELFDEYFKDHKEFEDIIDDIQCST